MTFPRLRTLLSAPLIAAAALAGALGGDSRENDVRLVKKGSALRY
jgi:hypothetical protein